MTRGNRRKTEDGFFFDEQKHGYFIKGGRLYPDGRNFTLLQQVFRRRLEGPFKLNKIKDFNSAKLVSSMMVNKGRNTKADLLRGAVFCGFCSESFSSGLTPKQRKDDKIYYYNYKCETDGCELRGKSVRVSKILDYAYRFLDEHVFDTESNYKQFIEDSKGYTAQYAKDLTSKVMSLTRIAGLKEKEYDNAKKFILTNPDLKDHYNLDEISEELNSLRSDLEKAKRQKADIKESILTYKEYLELFGSVSDKLRKTTGMALIDGVLRIFFSNFTVKQYGKGKEQRCEITHKLKEPWDGFLKNDDFSCGRGERTQTFDLTVPNRARYQLRHTPIGV